MSIESVIPSNHLILCHSLFLTLLIWLDCFFPIIYSCFLSVQFSSVAQSCLTFWDPRNLSTPGLPVHHQLPESTQTHVHWVSDTIQPSHSLSSLSLPALNLSQQQGLFQWVSSAHGWPKYAIGNRKFKSNLAVFILVSCCYCNKFL